MASGALKRAADSFMAECLDRLRKVPFSDIASWPEYPAKPPISLDVPEELSSYSFTLMKDTLPSGDLRVAIQRRRSRLLGITAEVTADGFVVAPDGLSRPLSQQDIRDLT